MSANNWSTCPKCKRLESDRQMAALTLAQEQYGKVPSNEYLKLLDDTKPRKLKQTMREDYELWIDEDDGKFSMHYRASCDECSFEFAYRHTEQAQSPTHQEAV